jgi:hypothetical protein
MTRGSECYKGAGMTSSTTVYPTSHSSGPDDPTRQGDPPTGLTTNRRPRVRPVPRTTPDRPSVKAQPSLNPARPGTTPDPVSSGSLGQPILSLTQKIALVSRGPADPPATPTRPSAPAWQVARQLCGPLVEVCGGARSASQVARWVAPDILAHLRQRARLSLTSSAPRSSPAVRRLRTCHLESAVEVSAVVDDTQRTRAVAMRLEPHRGRWRVTALELA